jgi:hypothetical protein
MRLSGGKSDRKRKLEGMIPLRRVYVARAWEAVSLMNVGRCHRKGPVGETVGGTDKNAARREVRSLLRPVFDVSRASAVPPRGANGDVVVCQHHRA